MTPSGSNSDTDLFYSVMTLPTVWTYLKRLRSTHIARARGLKSLQMSGRASCTGFYAELLASERLLPALKGSLHGSLEATGPLEHARTLGPK